MLKEIFTTDELEEMDHLINRINLSILMATAVVIHLPEFLDHKFTEEVTA
jgi:hypothetical protein